MTEMPKWERDLLDAQPINAAADQPAHNRAVSLARTLVPIIWGAVLTFAATRVPTVHDFVAAQETILMPALEAVLTGVWYVAFRWIESHLPAWATRLVLGANNQPVYVKPVVAKANPRGVA